MTYQHAVLSIFRPTEEGKKKNFSHADKTKQQLLGILYQLVLQRFPDNSKLLILMLITRKQLLIDTHVHVI